MGIYLVGDLQIPYQDNRAVRLFFDVMKSWKPHAIDIVGDIDDQLEYSTFSDGTTDEFFSRLKKEKQEEGETDSDFMRRVSPLPFIESNARGAREFYTDLRRSHKNADIHVSLGNHDIRILKYMDKKSPAHVGAVTPNFLWGLDDLGITWNHYDDKPKLRYGEIHVHHGATTTDTGLAVKGDIDKYGISLVRGHDHRGGVVYKTYPLARRKLQGMGTGHMCDPDAYGLRYTINPAWELGFGVGWVTGNDVQLQFIPITPQYTCVLNGKLYQG